MPGYVYISCNYHLAVSLWQYSVQAQDCVTATIIPAVTPGAVPRTMSSLYSIVVVLYSEEVLGIMAGQVIQGFSKSTGYNKNPIVDLLLIESTRPPP